MNLLSRESVCAKLRLSKWQSYGLFSGNRLHLVREADALAVANRSRVRIESAFRYVPELLTADEMSGACGVPVAKLMTWTRRTKNPIPHVRFNSHTIRFYRTAADEWLERMSR